MSTVIESTGLDDQNRERREGSVLWGKTKILLDERDSLLDEVGELRLELKGLQAQQPAPDKLQAMQARARHAGTTHSDDIHRAIDAIVELHRPQLASWTGTDTARAIWLTRRIYPDGATDKAGRPCGWRTVYNHLKTLSI